MANRNPHTTTYFVSCANNKRRQVTCVLNPDAHTAVFVREALQRILAERYGINNMPLIKTFRVQH